MQEVARVLHLQQRDIRDNPDIRDILKNKVIRRNAFVMFFIWYVIVMGCNQCNICHVSRT